MIAFVLGTRPEIIKLSPVIHEARRRGAPFVIIHTGQHYTPELDGIFFRELGLPEPTRNLRAGSFSPALQLGRMLEGLQEAFDNLRPTDVMVQGDTNSVLAGALAAHKSGLRLSHLEAGLRSDDWSMPEEANRVLAGTVADLHFCPTELQRRRLAEEGITEGVHVVGNSIVDAVLRYSGLGSNESRPCILGAETAPLHGTGRDKSRPYSPSPTHRPLLTVPYSLLTLHRPSNVDDPERLAKVMEMLDGSARELETKLVFPVHPRTEARLKAAGLWERYSHGSAFVFLPPVGFLELLDLEKNAALILTDSGGLQEEANILRVPCITLRENTERPETVEAGGNALYGGTSQKELSALAWEMLDKPRTWACPFGDGRTAERVMEVLSGVVK